MNYCNVGKSSWQELVGINGEAATQIIMRENPNVKAFVVAEGSVVTNDFKCDRVRVFVNYRGIVTLVPKIG
ncbi:inhibitor of trypsin and hageman factor-like [Abrus precatorius]|uniref:Inhibitor of trypsin and hageman factor-like n=1 Tax=Abrus precatorius TaxID=3816 RepID=A0A8B8M377_ABRPR|nr:inhibitor of trypsin and hageman factor-like [Abrus precatorius]